MVQYSRDHVNNSATDTSTRTPTLEPEYHTPLCEPEMELYKNIVFIRVLHVQADGACKDC